MALLSNPELLLLDEPTTALDVTVEAGIVELIKDISKRFGTSMIYISHNLGLILETCDRITVMYSGRGGGSRHGRRRSSTSMRHPYTRGLFNSIPLPGADKHARPLVPIRGQLPLPHERPQGCNFGPRCDHFVAGRCDRGRSRWKTVIGDAGHAARCRALSRDRLGRQPAGAEVARAGDSSARAGARSRRSEEILRDPRQLARRRCSRARDRASSRPTRSSTSTPARPRRWRSSASRAAASRPSPRC